jgi:hypothetical protein
MSERQGLYDRKIVNDMDYFDSDLRVVIADFARADRGY